MRAPFIPRVRADAFGRAPRDDEDLGRLARGYAKDELAGRVQVNHPTQLGIALTPRALAEATRPGAPAALLRAIPALPLLIEHALYLRTLDDPQHRPEVRWLKLLGARAEVAGRQVELLFLVRENVNGQCFLERVTERGIVRRRRDSGGGLPNGDATAAAGVDTGAPPELDIFVGGAGDASKGLVSGYRDSYSKRYGRNTQYFSWKDMDGILNAIRTAPPGTNVNVIAHSYGANAAALGIGMMAPTGLRVSRFISIDPVGRSPIPPEFRNAVGSWINVTSAPTTSDDSDKAAILGGKGGRLPTDQADIDYNVATNHENFSAMMTAPSPQGVSAEKMLVDGGWPQQQNPRLGEPFGGF